MCGMRGAQARNTVRRGRRTGAGLPTTGRPARAAHSPPARPPALPQLGEGGGWPGTNGQARPHACAGAARSPTAGSRSARALARRATAGPASAGRQSRVVSVTVSQGAHRHSCSACSARGRRPWPTPCPSHARDALMTLARLPRRLPAHASCRNGTGSAPAAEQRGPATSAPPPSPGRRPRPRWAIATARPRRGGPAPRKARRRRAMAPRAAPPEAPHPAAQVEAAQSSAPP